MGYTTSFQGKFTITPPLNKDQVEYINALTSTRRMKRDAAIAETFPDPVREKVGLPIGVDGEFFVGSSENFGQNHDKSVLDFNSPADTQPGLWCQWIASKNGNYLKWDGGEKFYEYVNWLTYIQNNILTKWGCKINGEIKWLGEDRSDRGFIQATDGVIRSLEGGDYDARVKEKRREKKSLEERKNLSRELEGNIVSARSSFKI